MVRRQLCLIAALLVALRAGAGAQTIYKVTIAAASDSAAVFPVRLVAPGWQLSSREATSITILDDTIRVNVPLVLELAVDDAAAAEFFAPDSTRRISVRVEARNLPRICDQSRPRLANKCPARSIVTAAVGTHLALDILRGEPRLSNVHR